MGVCGRYVSIKDRDWLAKRFHASPHVPAELDPDYNVAPGKSVYVVATRPAHEAEEPERQLRVMRWGLVPSWAKDPKIGNRLINARAETASSKPAFRAALARRRCVIPADGYYEWYQPDAPRGVAVRPATVRKQPFYIHRPDGGELALAGLYELWRDPGRADGDADVWLWTCVILTTAADPALSRIHDRAPVVVPDSALDDWLDPGLREPPADVLMPSARTPLEAVPVSDAVNSVRNNGPRLLEALPPEAAMEPQGY